MLHLQRKIKDGKIKEENDQVIFIQVAFFAVGAVLLLWYLAPWVLNHILNAGNVLGIAFAVMLLLTLPALIKGKLSRPQGIALLCIYAAFCVVQFTI